MGAGPSLRLSLNKVVKSIAGHTIFTSRVSEAAAGDKEVAPVVGVVPARGMAREEEGGLEADTSSVPVVSTDLVGLVVVCTGGAARDGGEARGPSGGGRV